MEHRVLTSIAQANELADEWKALVESCPSSVYDMPEFLLTSYEHFCTPEDELRIVTFYNSGSLVGLMPLYLTSRNLWGRRTRCLMQLGDFEGDCCGIIGHDHDQLWNKLYEVLEEDGSWEMLIFSELDLEDNNLTRGFENNSEYHLFSNIYSHRYLSDTSTDYDEYFAKLSKSSKKEINRKINKNKKQTNPFQLESHYGVTDIELAIENLNRFINIESLSWKANDGVGIGNKPHASEFYHELFSHLAREGKPSFWFLTSEGKDISSLIAYHHQHTLYMAHTTYDPAYAKSSPSLIATKGLLEYACDHPDITIYDPLATLVTQGRPRHKTAWSTHKDPIEMREVTILHKRGVIGMFARAKRIRDWINDFRETS